MSKLCQAKNEPKVCHPLREDISGKDVWKFLQQNIGNYLFGGHTYFGINAPDNIPEHTTSSLRGRLEGRILTWVESAMVGAQADATKDIIREILNSEFIRARDHFEDQGTDLMMEPGVTCGGE